MLRPSASLTALASFAGISLNRATCIHCAAAFAMSRSPFFRRIVLLVNYDGCQWFTSIWNVTAVGRSGDRVSGRVLHNLVEKIPGEQSVIGARLDQIERQALATVSGAER